MIMNEQQTINYNKIAEALIFIKENFKQQPDLNEIAAKINLSPFHFQRLFTEWAGVSPKKFLQFTSLTFAKSLLRNKQTTLLAATEETGLSGTGRLHDLFIKIEGMTPGEFKNGGEHLTINHSFSTSRFGNILIASTTKGICYIAFADDAIKALTDLKNSFSNASFKQTADEFHQNILQVFSDDWQNLNQIKLHLKGTDFQLKVWEALLKIPMGQLATYGSIATHINKPTASRAVGTAIGSNPVAFLIPCHRVIQASGNFGGYMWGNTRKTAMIGWEMAETKCEEPFF